MTTVTLSTEAYAIAKLEASTAGLSIPEWLSMIIVSRASDDFPFDDCGFPSPVVETR